MTRKHPIRTAFGVTAAVAMACGAAAIGAVAPASAIFGEAEISPIESNIGAKTWASVDVSSGASTAGLAIDQDDQTAWVAGDASGGQWLTLDLGGAYDNVRKVQVVFPDPGAVYQYVVESSADGVSWTVVADHAQNQQPGRGSVGPVHPAGDAVRAGDDHRGFAWRDHRDQRTRRLQLSP